MASLRVSIVRRLAALLWIVTGCTRPASPVADAPRLGQWVWTRADVARYAESAGVRPDLEAGVFIGAVHCDAASRKLVAHAGLPLSASGAAVVTAVIRFEDGLDRCRTATDSAHTFDASLDSVVSVLRSRGSGTRVAAVHLDFDAPQRALRAWAGSVRFLATHSLVRDSVWVTSLIAHLREPEYGDLFRGVVRGHVLQVFDTGEVVTGTQVHEAVRLATRARLPFRLGLGAFERSTRAGVTDHRAWFGAIARFAPIAEYRGIWIFPAGRSWISILGERS
ncbi:MAG: hypothetical protein H7099_03625 [Gemmatimonadaceae bacterium]|nr:hypothetical protein [Gemmatimonadaceae bacterium]